jgi:hypothetical protein
MILKDPPLHHVGIVQPAALALMKQLGLSEAYRGFVESFQALCIFTESAGRAPIEFVVPDGGPLERFNKGAGGLHRVAFEVPDLLALAEDFARRDMRMLEPKRSKALARFSATSFCPRRHAESSWNMCR